MSGVCRIRALAVVVLAMGVGFVGPEKLVAEEPKIPGPSTLVADALSQYAIGEFQRAGQLAELFTKTYRDDPRLSEMYLLQAKSLMAYGAVEGAHEVLEEMVGDFEELKESPDVLTLYGDVYSQSDTSRFEAADRYRRAASKYDAQGMVEETARVLNKLAYLYAKFGPWPAEPGGDIPATEQEQARIRRDLVFTTVDRVIQLAPEEVALGWAHLLRARVLAGRYIPGRSDAKQALIAYDAVLREAGETELAAPALFESATLADQELHDYPRAERRYETLIRKWGASKLIPDAEEALKNLRQPRLSIRWDDAIRPGERAGLRWTARNVDTIRLSAYRVELFALARSVGRLDDLTKWMPDQAAVASWTVRLRDDGSHRYLSNEDADRARIEIPLRESGTYVIEAEAKGVVSRTLVLISGIRAVTKIGTKRSLVRVVDAENGRGVAEAEVLMRRSRGPAGFAYMEGKTDASGMVSIDWSAAEKDRSGGTELETFVRKGTDAVVVRDGHRGRTPERLGPFRVYGWTDRDVYRPGQTVRFKQIVRSFVRGRYGTWANRPVKVWLREAGGEQIGEQSLQSNAIGCVWGRFALSGEIRPGSYEIVVTIGDYVIAPGIAAGNRIEVVGPVSSREADRDRRSAGVSVSTEDTLFRVGETVELHVRANLLANASGPTEAVVRVYSAKAGEKGVLTKDRIVAEEKAALDSAGQGTYRWPAKQEGAFIVFGSVEGAGSARSEETVVWVVGDGKGLASLLAAKDVMLVVGRKRYRQGSRGRAVVLSRYRDASAWVTAEADGVLFSQTVALRDGVGVIEIPMAETYTPSFELCATVVRGKEVFEARKEVLVSSRKPILDVRVDPVAKGKRAYTLGERAAFRVRCKDVTGQPVVAELAVRMVDTRMQRVADSCWSGIGTYFHGQPRPVRVRTASEFLPRIKRRATKDADEGRAVSSRPATDIVIADAVASGVWLPHVQTDEKGVAEIEIPMPAAKGDWRLEVLAVDGRSRVGEGSRVVATK